VQNENSVSKQLTQLMVSSLVLTWSQFLSSSKSGDRKFRPNIKHLYQSQSVVIHQLTM